MVIVRHPDPPHRCFHRCFHYGTLQLPELDRGSVLENCIEILLSLLRINIPGTRKKPTFYVKVSMYGKQNQ
jgi:hypothetical protein